jgi:mono/diheme cytochrome c family protein
MTNGARVFVEHCQQCHKLAGEGGDRAPELMGWARREWLVAVMRLAEEPRLFGPTKMRLMPPYDGPGEAEALAEYMLAEGGEKAVDAALVAKGKKLFADKECKNCHLYAGEGRDYGTPGPELKGYATAGWLEEFVHDPGGEKFFGPLNEMPKFGEKLTHKEIDDVVAYVLATRGEAMGPRHALTTPPPAAPASAPASEPASTPASAPASTPASAPAPAPAP